MFTGVGVPASFRVVLLAKWDRRNVYVGQAFQPDIFAGPKVVRLESLTYTTRPPLRVHLAGRSGCPRGSAPPLDRTNYSSSLPPLGLWGRLSG